MAANMGETRVEETPGVDTDGQRGQGGRQHIGTSGLVAAILVTVLVLGMAIHDQRISLPGGAATLHGSTNGAIRSMAAKTTPLPGVGRSDGGGNVGTIAVPRATTLKACNDDVRCMSLYWSTQATAITTDPQAMDLNACTDDVLCLSLYWSSRGMAR